MSEANAMDASEVIDFSCPDVSIDMEKAADAPTISVAATRIPTITFSDSWPKRGIFLDLLNQFFEWPAKL